MQYTISIILAARAAASEGAARQEAKTRGDHMLSMPAAELLGSWLVPAAVSAASGLLPRAVYAVTDCDPAACALNSATGGNAQMRVALEGARRLVTQWLAVHVHRHLNVDADRLSHPTMLADVAREAAEAGLRVRDAHITDDLWADALRAAEAGVGGPLEPAAWVAAMERLLFDTSRQLGHVLKGETHGLHVPPVLYR